MAEGGQPAAEPTHGSAVTGGSDAKALVESPVTTAAGSGEPVEPADRGPRSTGAVVLYYFHGTARCATCRKFESYSDEVIRTTFADELEDGSLTWRIINTDEAENEHFVSDYQLYTRALVVSKIREGEEIEWKNLDEIWELVRDKEAFAEYVGGEVAAFLESL